MDWQRAEAIVLRRQPVTETSLLVTWHSREFGKLKTLAKGARRNKGPFTGKIDLFFQAEIVFLPSRRSDLHLLHECFVINSRAALRESVERLAAGACACELVELIAAAEDPQPEIFATLAATLDRLAATPDPRVTLAWLALRLLALAGWRPRWGGATAARRLLTSLMETSLDGAQRIRLTPAQLAMVRAAVGRFWVEQVGRAPRAERLLELRGRKSGVDTPAGRFL